MEFIKQIKTSITLLIFFSIFTGLIYPAIITAVSQLFFPWKANGSLIIQNNQIIGSALIGQSFTDAKYFWGRPSATTPFPYNAQHSSGSNLGPSNPNLLTAVKNRIATLRLASPTENQFVPVDLVTSSASGVDPDISPFAAFYQIRRIANARHLPENVVEQLVQNAIQTRTLKIFGEPRVNVLQLNLALDDLSKTG